MSINVQQKLNGDLRILAFYVLMLKFLIQPPAASRNVASIS